MRDAVLTAGMVLAMAAGAAAAPASSGDRTMSRKTLADKIRGGWAGQMIGVAYGAPTEFKSQREDQRREAQVGPGPASRTRSTRTTSTSR